MNQPLQYVACSNKYLACGMPVLAPTTARLYSMHGYLTLVVVGVMVPCSEATTVLPTADGMSAAGMLLPRFRAMNISSGSRASNAKVCYVILVISRPLYS